jgi:hypothetical protein
MKKTALFAFNGDPMCFVHVLLNALDMKEKGYDIKLVIEGSAVKLIPELAETDNMMHGLYVKCKEQGIIDAACKACSAKMKVTDDVEKEGLPFADEMSGHPSMARYRDDGYEILIF